IAIGSRKGMEGHRNAVTDVLKVAEEHDLYFKPEKCVFHAPSIDYLGVILEGGVTRMDPVKVEGVRNWPACKNLTDAHAFLGFCNYYRMFIQGFAKHAKPITTLTKKDVEWHWGEEQQQAMDTLKTLVTSEPVLAHPHLDQPFELEVDASGYAIGAVLMQRQKDEKRHPIAFYSATLNAAERNYDIYDLELLAIVRSLEHWRTFLAGSPHTIKVFSDHMNLQYWRQPQKISRRVAREVLTLSEYNIAIHHIQGKKNGRADALSRRPDYDKGTRDNEHVTVLPDRIFVRAATIGEIERNDTGEFTVQPITVDIPYVHQDEEVL